MKTDNNEWFLKRLISLIVHYSRDKICIYTRQSSLYKDRLVCDAIHHFNIPSSNVISSKAIIMQNQWRLIRKHLENCTFW